MSFEFRFVSRNEEWPTPQFLEEIEGDPPITHIFDMVCDYLHENNIAQFQISGFGQSEWPVDTRTDASIFLEQLPLLCRLLSGEQSKAIISLYEQGIERDLLFTELHGNIAVTCVSKTKWVPKPLIEQVDKPSLVHMCHSVRLFVSKVIAYRFSELTATDAYRVWSESTELKNKGTTKSKE